MKFFSRKEEEETPKEMLSELQKNIKTPAPQEKNVIIEENNIEHQVIEVLKTIYDPEIPVNIYALGLIYNIDISEDNDIQVDMTLTSPACPVAETLPPMIEQSLKLQIPEANMTVVQVVWEPPWDQTKMSEEAKLELGMF